MKNFLLLLILAIAACATRTQTLDRLIGTNIENLLPKWDEPQKIIELKHRNKAYAFVSTHVQSKSIEQSVGSSGVKTGSEIFALYTVITTQEDGTIISWDVKRLKGYLDSTSLLQVFELHPL
jgi:hypothetical protein